jgi:Fe-Mn family superoxide dismutase
MYQLPNLPYSYDALEPHIEARIVELQHGRHHAGYVGRLNELLSDRKQLSQSSLDAILGDIRKVPEDIRQEVRNAAGGHLNHSLLWRILGPPRGLAPSGALLEAIEGCFGSIGVFRQEFTRVAMARFGSGWAWLCVDGRGHLELASTPNEDSPIMLDCRPVLGLDLWEHAYYLQYQNRREEYIKAFWSVLDWPHANELYLHSMDRVRSR